MNRKLLFISFLLVFVIGFSQSKNLLGTWVLDKVFYYDGKAIEANNELFSYELIYEISNKKIIINDRIFDAVYSDTGIYTTTRKINYEFRNDYLLIRDEGDKKYFAFLKRENFIKKYPEFEPKKEIRNGDTLWISNPVTKPIFNSDDNILLILSSSKTMRLSKEKDLYFKGEFVVTKNNKIKNIRIIDGYNQEQDHEYLYALKQLEGHVNNPYGHDLLVTTEKHFLRYYDDLEDSEDKTLFKIIEKGDEYYNKQQFENAIAQFEKLKKLQIGENRFKSVIDNANLRLGISYLGTNQIDKACTTFRSIGDKTNFKVRNYLINFCNKE
ncbi:tol-pal system YbgF family protein [Epilithonimonas sp. UC225_85]|uniref:tetratricopeptide repeat protein n=1 Tax=Epilithonimonas sp. UC225_85 TaxID=3350167 RepID=UPI0036D2D88D